MCELEVTESVVMGHGGEVVRTLDDLSRRGFSLSLDDFGTGYSSLSYLRRVAWPSRSSPAGKQRFRLQDTVQWQLPSSPHESTDVYSLL